MYTRAHLYNARAATLQPTSVWSQDVQASPLFPLDPLGVSPFPARPPRRLPFSRSTPQASPRFPLDPTGVSPFPAPPRRRLPFSRSTPQASSLFPLDPPGVSLFPA
eukprot:104785-Chlamydomonas_euryale.AAC.1